MKRIKKVMALVIAAAMVMGMMSVSAFAATENRSISIGGLDEGDKVTFYQVLKWADDTDEANANKAVSGYYWAEPFATVFNVNGDKGSAKLKAAINDDNQLIITDELAGDIARAINGQTVTPIASNVEETDGVATYTFQNVNTDDTDTHGLYMAVITPADQDVVYNPVFVELDTDTEDEDNSYTIVESAADYMNTPAGSGAAKKSRVTLTKEAENENDYNADNGDTAKPGDILDFTVTSTIPGYGDTFQHPFFTLTDKLKGLSLFTEAGAQIADIVVKVGGEEVTASATTFTFDPATTAGQYTIKFSEAFLKDLHIATPIEVTYKARVLPGANTNVIKEKNTVTLEFSHDPTTENDSNPGGEKQYKKDITNHYTFSIDANNLVGPTSDRIGDSGSEIIKIGVDKNGEPITSTKVWSNVTETAYQAGPLAGAEFTLYGATYDKDADTWTIDTSKVIGTATSDASGRLNFTGLDAGHYFLQETKAPAGYVKQSDPVEVAIDATLQEKTITEYYDQQGNWYSEGGEGRTAFEYKTEELVSYSVTYGNQASTYTFDHVHESNSDEIKWNITQSGEAPQSIVNTKGVELPSTGGIGTTLFYVIGAVLVLGAGILLVTRRRMNAN